MDTPLSMRRITRSQAALNSHKKSQGEATSIEKGRRSVLLDITNDSPIVGLAAGSIKTPASSLPMGRCAPKPTRTPGSGEELLRGQVKDLLQKVDEETEVVKPMSSSDDKSVPATAAPFRALLGHLLQAPTPANTPQVLDLSSFQEQSDGKLTSQVSSTEAVLYPTDQVEYLGECQLNRALLFDSPEKSGMSMSSGLTYQGSSSSVFPEKLSDDDSSSIWSIQANASSEKEDIEEEEEEDDDEIEENHLDDECRNEGLLLDDLCDGFRKIAVVEEGKSVGLPEFTGKHTRFVYNANDEIEDVVDEKKPADSPNVFVLKGIPAPEGKHIRFHDEEE